MIEARLQQATHIIFDCDGVIFDTNNTKNRAFEETLRSRGFESQYIEKFIEYHKQKGGVSRYAKFRYFFTDILKTNVDEEEYNVLLEKYAQLSVSGYIKGNLTDSFVLLVELLIKNGKHCYVLSGSDQNELLEVFRHLGLDHYFEGIYGSPLTKYENIQRNLSFLLQNEVLYLGDSTVDLEVANYFGFAFIGILEYSDNPEELLERCILSKANTVNNLGDLLW